MTAAATTTTATTRAHPGLRCHGAVPASSGDPRLTLREAVAASARRTLEAIAGESFGAAATCREPPRTRAGSVDFGWPVAGHVASATR